MACQQWVVAFIKDDAVEKFTFNARAFFGLNLRRRTGADIENLDIFQTIAQCCVDVGSERFAQFHRDPVVPLIVDGAQVISLAKEYLTAKRETPIKKVRFR